MPSSAKFDGCQKTEDVSDVSRLTNYYPAAWHKDFYGLPSNPPCVYNSGPAWRERTGPETYRITREARPVYDHPIADQWRAVGTSIYQLLDSQKVKWTSIDPVAFSEEGEATPFCSLLMWIGVHPKSLPYDAAVAAASPRSKSHFSNEGTGALYLRVGDANRRTVLLTAAHVARPPFTNPSIYNSKDAEDIITLGNKSYSNAVTGMLDAIADLTDSIDIWNDNVARLSEPVEGEEDEETVDKRQEYLDLVNKAKKKIEKIHKLHHDLSRFTPMERTIGFVRHIEPIVRRTPFICDWALIELYDEEFDWDSFKGNKIYVGGNLSSSDYSKIMYPRPEDRAGYKYPRDGLLQARRVVKDGEICSPQRLDANGQKCLHVVKNGMATGTTVGRVNGLESFTRFYTEHGVEQTSVEVAALPYDKRMGAFSAHGDSGAVVLERGGGIVGMLTGGSGTTEGTDIGYLTPYWWLEEQIKQFFPNCYLYETVQ